MVKMFSAINFLVQFFSKETKSRGNFNSKPGLYKSQTLCGSQNTLTFLEPKGIFGSATENDCFSFFPTLYSNLKIK